MTSTAHDITTPGPPRGDEVSDGIHAYLQPDGTWWINNTGFLVGQRGLMSELASEPMSQGDRERRHRACEGAS